MRQLEPPSDGPDQTLDLTATVQSTVPAPLPSEVMSSGYKRDYAGMLEYWQMIRRHPAAVILATVLGGVVGFLTTLPSPRIYQARTTLEIQGLNEDFLNLNLRNLNPTVSPTSTYYPDFDIQTQVQILESASLIRMVAAKMTPPAEALAPVDRLNAWRKALNISSPTQQQLWNQALGMAAGSIRVRASGTNRIVDVSCDSTSPQLAAKFVNTLAKEYIDQNLEARWQSSEHTGEWLTNQLRDLKLKLENSEDELQAYIRATQLNVTSDKGESADQANLADLQKQLSEAQMDRIEKESKYEIASSSPPDSNAMVLDDLALKTSEESLIDLRKQLAQLRVSLTPNHPDVRRVQAQITSLEASLQKERADVLRRIRNDYDSAVYREKLLSATYAKQAQLVSAEAAKMDHYAVLKREVDATRTLYETLMEKLKEASIASALHASNIRVVDAADIPGGPYKPDVHRSAMLGILAGLCLGIAFAVLRERSDRTIQDPGDLAYYLKLPELGVVPMGKPQTNSQNGGKLIPLLGKGLEDPTQSRGLPELTTWHSKHSLLAESFRTTLTSVLFSGSRTVRSRVLVLTSASPKEGKTTVVSNLAIAFAEIQSRVLLIDGDMRRPRIHTLFEVENEGGFADLLASDAPLSWEKVEAVIQKSGIPGLHVMCSGKTRHNVGSLLYSSRLPELLALLRSKFETVLIDSPPMVNIADARVMARQADGLILVARSGITTRDAGLLAKQRFSEDGVHVIGTILNAWNPNVPGYGYYRHYYAGYYHYYGNGNGKKPRQGPPSPPA